MELQEFKNIDRVAGDRPPELGWTLLVQPDHGKSPDDLLKNVKEAWVAVSQWGTWWDEPWKLTD